MIKPHNTEYTELTVNLNKSIVVTFLENVGCGFQNFGEEILQHNEKARCNIVEYTTAFQYFD